MLTDSFPRMLLLSTGIGAVCGFVGIYLSYFVDVSSGATIVLVESAVFTIAMAYSTARSRLVSVRQRESRPSPIAAAPDSPLRPGVEPVKTEGD